MLQGESGIDSKWFENTAKDILSGKYNFTPAREKEIPKPGKKEMRSIITSSPREKSPHKGDEVVVDNLVQKALQVLLEAIYEPKFLDCSHGFRPNKSTHSA